VVCGTGHGLIADLCVGIVGALIGDWLLPRLGIHLATGLLTAIISGTIGGHSAVDSAARASAPAVVGR
jgi:uncharacterized membrane protein YeaQ/YmgE (transglycosylase-associated protein family)